MSFFTPTEEEIQAMRTGEEYERNKAAVILETELKNNREAAEHERYEREHYKVSDPLLEGLFDSIANGIERWFNEIRKQIKESLEARERQEYITKLEQEAEKFLKEAKDVADLERRAAEVKKVFEILDRDYKHTKGDTAAERLRLNKDLDLVIKAQEACNGIKDKFQAIDFTDRQILLSELKRCHEKENTIELRISNSDLQKRILDSVAKMRDQSEAATAKLRELYTSSKDWDKHQHRDADKYYYKEPAHLFNGEGIPKASETGRAIAKQLDIRNTMEKGITDSNAINNNLYRVQPDFEHNIKVNRGEDLLEKIKNQSDAARRTIEQPELDHTRSR